MKRIIFIMALMCTSMLFSQTKHVVTTGTGNTNAYYGPGNATGSFLRILDAAANGDTIVIDPSVTSISFTGDAFLRFPEAKANLVIIGHVDALGKPAVAIQGSSSSNNNQIVQIEGDGIKFQNFVIQDGNANSCMRIEGNDVTVTNIEVKNCSKNGIEVSNTLRTQIKGSYIHENNTSQDRSTTWRGFGANVKTIDFAGIKVTGSKQTIIEGNNVSGNFGDGIFVDNSKNTKAAPTRILNNIVGASRDSSTVFGNMGDGIHVKSSDYVNVGEPNNGNWTVGNGNRSFFVTPGTLTTVNGVITENMVGDGIEIRSSGFVNVQSNKIGSSFDGTTDLDALGKSFGNHHNGIYLKGSNNLLIGGDRTLLEGNLVVGNGYAFQDLLTRCKSCTESFAGVRHGIQLQDNEGAQTYSKVEGNLIGFGLNGTCLPNKEDGVSLLGWGDGTNNNVIGNPTNENRGNIIGAGHYGIAFQGTEAINNSIYNNVIGAFERGGTGVCGGMDAGIKLQNGSSGTYVDKNYITNTDKAILIIEGSNGNEIGDNTISCNNEGVSLSNGNKDYGNSYINTGDVRANVLSGFSPGVGDDIRVYIKDTCGTTCQEEVAKGKTGLVEGVNTGVLKLIRTITSKEDTEFGSVSGREGYWEFDLTHSSAVAAGLTKFNAVITSTDANGNTSELSVCSTFVSCQPPKSVALTSNNSAFCEGGSATLITTKVKGDPTDVESDFRYKLYTTADLINHVDSNATGAFTVTETGIYRVKAFHIDNETECAAWSTADLTITEVLRPKTGDLTLPDDSLCEESTIDLSVALSNAANNILWTVVSGDADFQADNVNPAKLNLGTKGSVAIKVVEITSTPIACPDLTGVTALLNAHERPSGFDLDGPTTVCALDTALYTVQNSDGYSFEWSLVAGTSTGITANTYSNTIAWSSLASGSISTWATDSITGCRTLDNTPDKTTITINAVPKANTDLDGLTVCNKSDLTFNLNASDSSTFEWTVTGATPTSGSGEEINVTVDVADEILIRVIETITATGCKTVNPLEQIIKVNSKPNGGTITASPNDSVCVGTEVTLSVVADPNLEYEWKGANGASFDHEFIFTPDQTTKVTLAVTDKTTLCKTNVADEDEITITVLQNLSLGSIVGNDTVQCSAKGEKYAVSNNTAGNIYNWNFSDIPDATSNGSTADSVLINFGQFKGQLQVSAISALGCPSDTLKKSVTIINCKVTANFNAQNNVLCDKDKVTFISKSAVNKPNEVVYTWTFENATPATITGTLEDTVSVVFNSFGTFDVNLTIQEPNGTPHDTTFAFTINPLPTFTSADINGPRDICEEFEDSLWVNDDNATYTWSIKSGDLRFKGGLSDTLKYTDFGAKTSVVVVVKDQLGCKTTDSIKVNVMAGPKLKTISGQKVICQGDEITYFVNATAGSKYTWTKPVGTAFVGDSTTASIVIAFNSVGKGLVSVLETNADGCFLTSNKSTLDVETFSNPVKPIITTKSTDICAGDTASFSVSGTGLTYAWETDLDLVSTLTVNPLKAVVNADGFVKVVVKDIHNCKNESDIMDIKLIPLPTLTIDDIYSKEQVCKGFRDSVVVLTDKTAEYSWDGGLTFKAGDYKRAANYTQLTSYNITKRVNGCVAKLDVNVGIYSPNVAIELLQPVKPCEGNTIVLQVANPLAGSTFKWTLPNGTAFTTDSINHTINVVANGVGGTVTVMEISKFGCFDESLKASKKLDILKNPAKPVISGPTYVCSNEEGKYEIKNGLVNGITYEWSYYSFRDDKSFVSTDMPLVIKGGNGVYNISVSAKNADGCPTVAETIKIFESLIPTTLTITHPNIMCEGSENHKFVLKKGNGDDLDPLSSFTWKWDSDIVERLSGDVKGTTNTYKSSDGGTFGLTVVETNAGGCKVETKENISFNYDVELPTITLPARVCDFRDDAREYVTFTVTAEHADSFSWSFDNLEAIRRIQIGENKYQYFVDTLGEMYESLKVSFATANALGTNVRTELTVKGFNECRPNSSSVPVFIEKSRVLNLNLTANEICSRDSMLIEVKANNDVLDNWINVNSIGQSNGYIYPRYKISEDTITNNSFGFDKYVTLDSNEVIDTTYEVTGTDSTMIINTSYVKFKVYPIEFWSWFYSQNFLTDSLTNQIKDVDYYYEHYYFNDSLYANNTQWYEKVDNGDPIEVWLSTDRCVITDESKVRDTIAAQVLYPAIVEVGVEENENIEMIDDFSFDLGPIFMSNDINEITLLGAIDDNDVTFANSITNYTYDWKWKQKSGSEIFQTDITSPEGKFYQLNTETKATTPRIDTVEYIYTVYNKLGCPTIASVYVKLIYDVFIPSIFTPNGDGIKETWEIFNGDKYPEMSFLIYNRWGTLVYSKTGGYSNDWGGENSSGNQLSAGVYFYVLDIHKEGVTPFNGTVTIVGNGN